jgi:hypothetical protein
MRILKAVLLVMLVSLFSVTMLVPLLLEMVRITLQ